MTRHPIRLYRGTAWPVVSIRQLASTLPIVTRARIRPYRSWPSPAMCTGPERSSAARARALAWPSPGVQTRGLWQWPGSSGASMPIRRTRAGRLAQAIVSPSTARGAWQIMAGGASITALTVADC
jgi:hypothetical protein